ncbi:DUF6328 family protein [Geobacter sp. SVR]|uniref:DUF6328 family protein n=1 Tax=Geobacter sp. SVR TaxID=2495594 RepID=UPI00143EF952|nr:DUF6328 family protein [Geobacter sp. SVR]BCS52508.1 hypothetical protein GSVR_08160 [Geobacter sp. SVR]GCF84055.1 hypothetical protein GSbR_06550 [Geobacter sp. SVR]
MGEQQKEQLPMPEAVTHLLKECRMVLPGIQALFGFQLIVVFNPGFEQKLQRGEQLLHLSAIGLVGVAVALVMAPAAYHRQVGPQKVSQDFIGIASRLLLWSMFPLMLGICFDFYLVSKIIVHDAVTGLLLSVILLCVYYFLWFVVPRLESLRNTQSSPRR